MRLVIMQPTYLPWIGYFDLIEQSDVFVFLDSAQFEKQSWQQRNRLKTPSGPQWITVPVYQSLGQKIVDVKINETAHWCHKHWMALVSNYGKAPHWKTYGPLLEATYKREWSSLAEVNIHVIGQVCQWLGIAAEFVRSSSLPPLLGAKTEPLLELCRHFRADTYLSPAGSRAYLSDDAPFRSQGVTLEFHAYEHPTYPQLFGEFVPYLSIVDLLMNAGPESAALLRSGRRPSTPVTPVTPAATAGG